MAYNNYPVAYPQMYPQYQSYTPHQQGIIWVQGKNSAQSYVLPAGQSAILMDSDGPYVYKKETAMDGRPLPMETYKLVREDEPAKQEEKRYVSMDEINEIVSNQVENIVKDEVERRLSEFSFRPTRKKNAEE